MREFLNFKKVNTSDPRILKRVYNGQDIILKQEKEDTILVIDACVNKVAAVYTKLENDGFYRCHRGLYNEDNRSKGSARKSS